MKKRIIISTVLSLTTLWAGFDFGECSGSATFKQQINHYNGDYEKVVEVGTIPQGIIGLRVELISDKDVDIRLYGDNSDKIVHWPYGLLHGSRDEKAMYKDVNITYSGYNGVDGEKGHEYIEVEGSTPTNMTMKAFGYKAGFATVNYSWIGKVECEVTAQGSASFQQDLEQNATAFVGVIPAGIKNLMIELSSSDDIDIQLYTQEGTPLVKWHGGLLDGAGKQILDYQDMQIEWSGYNGVNGHAGDEYIKVTPQTSQALIMKVFGYQSGVADVNYSWGTEAKVYPPTVTLQSRNTDNTVPKPTVGHDTIDPVYHTRIKMVDKADHETSAYPKVQNWNHDMSLLRINNRIYDATTLQETDITKNKTQSEAYHTLCSRGSDYFRWSNKVANRFFVLNSSHQFIQAEINGNSVDCSEVLDNFNEFEVVHMGPHEGNIDNDDKYVVFVAKKPDDTTFYVLLYDIKSKSRVWTKTMPSQTWEWVTKNGSSFWAPSTLDWLSVSQSGNYIVFNNDNGYRDGMYRYDINFENKVKLQYRWEGNGELYSEGGHGDLGYDTNGHEVFVQFISGLGVYSFNLDNPQELGKELLHSPYGGGHISCRNTERKGWCYITANTDSNGNGLKDIFALKIDGTGDENVEHFSQSHINTGFHDTYGGTSPDGTKVIFNSHWRTNAIDTFIAEAE